MIAVFYVLIDDDKVQHAMRPDNRDMRWCGPRNGDVIVMAGNDDVTCVECNARIKRSDKRRKRALWAEDDADLSDS